MGQLIFRAFLLRCENFSATCNPGRSSGVFAFEYGENGLRVRARRIPLLEGSVTMKVPPGVRSGQRLRVKGKGIQRAGADPADFHAVLQIESPRTLDERQKQLLEELAPTLPNPRTGPAWQ